MNPTWCSSVALMPVYHEPEQGLGFIQRRLSSLWRIIEAPAHYGGFAVVMAATTLLATFLHGIEAGI
jgi:hypothetical protein